MKYMAQPGRLRRSGRSLKTNEKSVENNLTNRLAHKNSDTPSATRLQQHPQPAIFKKNSQRWHHAACV